MTGDEGSWLLLIPSHYILHPATHIDLYNAHQDLFCLVEITFSVVLYEAFPHIEAKFDHEKKTYDKNVNVALFPKIVNMEGHLLT